MCLHIGSDGKTWSDARTYCAGIGGKLVDLINQTRVNIARAYGEAGAFSGKLHACFFLAKSRSYQLSCGSSFQIYTQNLQQVFLTKHSKIFKFELPCL